MDFELTAEQRAMRELARRVGDEFRPRAADVEASGRFPWENIRRLAEVGLMGVTIPPEYGGVGGNIFDAVLVMEEIARGCYVTAMAALGELGVQSQILARFADDRLKQRILPRVVRGESILAIAISEPEAGSDAGHVATRAEAVPGGVRLRGNKIYISRADVADVFIVYCRFGEIPGARGVGAVALERGTPGFAVTGFDTTMGGERLGQLFFDDCFVPDDHVLTRENGFRLMMEAFNGQRLLNASICLGLAQGALEEAIRYARERRQFDRRLADFQGLRWMLADMHIDVEAARLLIWRAAVRAGQGFPDVREAAVAKTYANEMAIRVTNQALQIFGAAGYLRGSYVERALRGARFGAIGGGTAQIQRNLIAHHLLDREP